MTSCIGLLIKLTISLVNTLTMISIMPRLVLMVTIEAHSTDSCVNLRALTCARGSLSIHPVRIGRAYLERRTKNIRKIERRLRSILICSMVLLLILKIAWVLRRIGARIGYRRWNGWVPWSTAGDVLSLNTRILRCCTALILLN